MKERTTIYENNQLGGRDLFPADALLYINGVLAPIESAHVASDRTGSPEVNFTMAADKSLFRLGKGDSVDVMVFVYDAQTQRYGLRFWGDIVAWGKGRGPQSTTINFTAVDKSYVLKNFILEFVRDAVNFAAFQQQADAGMFQESVVGSLSSLMFLLYGTGVSNRHEATPVQRPFDYVDRLIRQATVDRDVDKETRPGHLAVTWPGAALDTAPSGTFGGLLNGRYNTGTFFRADTHVKVAVGGTITEITNNHLIDSEGSPDPHNVSRVVVRHATDGESIYEHVSTQLSVGDVVEAGDTLGFADGTGYGMVPKVLGAARLTEYQNYAQGEFFKYKWYPSTTELHQLSQRGISPISVPEYPTVESDDLIQNSGRTLIIGDWMDPLLLLGSPRFGTVTDSPLRLFSSEEDGEEVLATPTPEESEEADVDSPLSRFFDRYMRAWAMVHRFVASPIIEEHHITDEHGEVTDYVFPVFKEVSHRHLMNMVAGATEQFQAGGLYHIIEALMGLFYFELQPITNPNFVYTDPEMTDDETPKPKNAGRIVDNANGVPTLTSYVSKPVSVFSLPPRCNVFFDSVIQSLNYNESYATQPTRVYMSADTIHTQLGADVSKFGHHTAYPLEAYERFRSLVDLTSVNPRIGPARADSKNLIIWKEEYFRGPAIASQPTLPSYMAMYANRSPAEVIPGVSHELATKLRRRQDFYNRRKSPDTTNVRELYRVSSHVGTVSSITLEQMMPMVAQFCLHPDIQLRPEVLAGLIAQESAWDHNAVFDPTSNRRQARTLLQMFPGAAVTAYDAYKSHIDPLLDAGLIRKLASLESNAARGAALIERAMNDPDPLRGRRLAIHLGGAYLKTRMTEFNNDYAMALTAYHTGAHHVKTARNLAGEGASVEQIIANQIRIEELADHSKEHALTHAAMVLNTAQNIQRRRIYPGFEIEPRLLTAPTIPTVDMAAVQRHVNEILKVDEEDGAETEDQPATHEEAAVDSHDRVYFRAAAIHYYVQRYRQRGGTAQLIGDHPYVAVGFPGIFLDEKTGMYVIAMVDRVEWSFSNGQVGTVVHFSMARLLDEAIEDTKKSRLNTDSEIDIGPADPVLELQDLQRKETADLYYQRLFGCDSFSLEEFKEEAEGDFLYDENLWTDQRFLRMPSHLQPMMQSYEAAMQFNQRGVATLDQCMQFLESHTGSPIGRIGPEVYHGAPYYRKLDFKYVYIDDNLEKNRSSLRNLYLQSEQWTTRIEYLNRLIRGWHTSADKTGAAAGGKSTINLVGGATTDWGNVR